VSAQAGPFLRGWRSLPNELRLNILAAIASGSLGFSNIHHLSITFSGEAVIDARSYLETIAAIEFSCRVLKIAYYHHTAYRRIKGFGLGYQADLLEMSLLQKLTIGAGKRQPKVEWETYYETFKGSSTDVEHLKLVKEPVDQWPAITARSGQRVTEKTMCI
jgi:hypothetical protein